MTNLTLSVDERTLSEARRVAESMGKSLNQVVRDYLEHLAGGRDLDRDLEDFRRLSGQGDSQGWKFNRDEIHERS
ncbi:MAG: DUF6364 family protein [Chloroflexota bacterium]